ncbi:MAG: hypothetical protein MRY57_00255 [Candidatus Pacebacteria bacterium]|nr:hypothetical protein [Candidatus Paceibacterota bacterium]
MEIIKEGSPHGWSREYECTGHGNGGGGCGALLLVTEDDVYQTSRSFYDGSTDYYVTFTCIGCGVATDIVSDGKNCSHDVPSRVRDKARNKKRK